MTGPQFFFNVYTRGGAKLTNVASDVDLRDEIAGDHGVVSLNDGRLMVRVDAIEAVELEKTP